ncbi:MAG: hypothetical protein ACD_23C00645G0001, partial [uncultured bacterium]
STMEMGERMGRVVWKISSVLLWQNVYLHSVPKWFCLGVKQACAA